ncbi:unnamed protein product [Plasmodium vivax]|uniref:(malaria parasite P. vivax) hypothetical protein n=1 Tax=Plasmodium vivax TaxID=5855 RepID=A0A8S4HL05_PLAVI|nr:unnamed protein product [Plasmodium vivax]
MNEAKKCPDQRPDQRPPEEDPQFDGPCGNGENSNDGSVANISNIATVNFASLEREFRRIYRYPSQERPPSVSQQSQPSEPSEQSEVNETNEANEADETHEDDYFCGKARGSAHVMPNQSSEETLHTQRAGMHTEGSVGRALPRGEQKQRADHYGGMLPPQFERRGPTGMSSQGNFASTNSIEHILRSIQEDTILGINGGGGGNSGGCSSNVAPRLADAVDAVQAIHPVRGSPPADAALVASPSASSIRSPAASAVSAVSAVYAVYAASPAAPPQMCRLWWGDKPFAYRWERGMNRQEVQRCVHNFCINIANEEFYLVRLERLPEDNLLKEKQKNIQRILLRGNTYAYYKLCERYEHHSLGDLQPNEEYLIKRKNQVQEKLMNPLNFPEVLRAIEYTKEGGNLLKHTVYSIPHLRFFFISKDLNFIKWFSSRKTDEQCKIYFDKINSLEIKIVHEHLLENLKVNILKRLSFSIVYMNEKKKVTLTCKSLQEFNYWVTTIRALMFRAKRMKTTRSVLLSHVSGGDGDEGAGGDTLSQEWSNSIARWRGAEGDAGRPDRREVSLSGNSRPSKVCASSKLCESSTSSNPRGGGDPSKWSPQHGEAQPNKGCELKGQSGSTKKELHTEEGKTSLESFHLYKLIVFPDCNLCQVKTKFYLLKEKAYKYRILIEKEIDEYHMEGGLHPEGGTNLEGDANTERAPPPRRNSPPRFHFNFSGNFSGNEAGKEDPARGGTLSKGKRKGTWSSSSSPHVALPEVYTLNRETNLSIRDGGEVSRGTTPSLAAAGEAAALGGRGDPVGGNHEDEAEEDTDQFKLQLIVKIYNRIDVKLKQVQKDIMHVVQVLKREESEQPAEQPTEKQPSPQGGIAGFSLEHLWKYTTDAYRTLEGKIYKAGDNRHGGDSHYVGGGRYSGDDRYAGDGRYSGDGRYPHSNEPPPQLPRSELRQREERPDPLAPKACRKQSSQLIHDILFDMWLCEMEFGNIEDIYATYVSCSKRKKNFMANVDAPAFVKNISQQISSTILRYMNM